MLIHLSLRDLAVVSRADVAFGPGMTVLSGETGAGKSLIVDALLLLTGTRAESGLVRHGAERAELGAEFRLEAAGPALDWLRDNDLDDADTDGGCSLRRVIRADGGSRAWINGRQATLGQLSELGSMLVEIHGQHEHQALLDRAHQLDLLDAFGRHEPLRSEVAALARQWRDLDREISSLEAAGDPEARLAYLQHQRDELDRESLEPVDIEELLRSHRRQSAAASLLASYDNTLLRLSSDDDLSPARGLGLIAAELHRQLDSEPLLKNVLELIETTRLNIDEVETSIGRLRDEVDLDPHRLQALDERLGRLHDLARKHRVPMDQLGACRDAIAGEIDALREGSERRQRIGKDRDEVAVRWRDAAATLTRSRLSAADDLARDISALMAELDMVSGVFEVQFLAVEEGRPAALGAERCEFLVSANPGQPARPLRKTASGGELARISLAIEVALLGLDSVPTMVFDEVDAGIGGAVAEVVGQKLRALGAARQVLCVTHLPQVAAQGHRHLRVSKAVVDSQTHSIVSELDEAARIEEVARMLGGVAIAEETRANARQMLATAQSL